MAKIRDGALADLFDASRAPEVRGNALFERVAGQYLRLRLDRDWATGRRALLCMSNPSDAGAAKNDPTILSATRLFQALGYAGYTVVNRTPHISSAPAESAAWEIGLARDDPEALAEVCRVNVALIREVFARASTSVVAWGNLVQPSPVAREVLRALSGDFQTPLYCFGVTKSGAPIHPGARGQHRIVAGQPLEIWNHLPFLEQCK